jgi:hypothetical protein
MTGTKAGYIVKDSSTGYRTVADSKSHALYKISKLLGKDEAGYTDTSKPSTTTTTGKFSLSDYGRRDWTKEDERNAIRKYPAEIKRIGDSFLKNKLGSGYGDYGRMNGRQEANVDRVLDGVEKRIAASGLLTSFEVNETVRALRTAARMKMIDLEEAAEKEFGSSLWNVRFLTEPWEKAKKEGDFLIGRTEFDSPDVDNEVLVKLKHDDYVRLGDFANVRITDANDFDLFGELI